MIRVGIVGLGSIAQRHLNNLTALIPDAKILGVSASGRTDVDINNDNFELLSSPSDLLEQKPSFVIVASPSPWHFRHCKVFHEANIPVLVEKPLCADLDDAKAFLSLKEGNSTPLGLAYCLRFLPELDIIRRMITVGDLGRIISVESHVGQYLPDWRADKDFRDSVSARPELGGGVLLEISHELDYLQHLLGPLTFNNGVLRESETLALSVEACADLSLTSKQGTVCSVHLDFLQKQSRRTCVLSGTEGRIEWDLIGREAVLISPNERRVLFQGADESPNEKYLQMLNHFIEHLKGHEYRGATIEEGYSIVHLIDEIKQGASWGSAV